MTYFQLSAILILAALLGGTGCKSDDKAIHNNWVFEKNISLDSFGIVGIASAGGDNLWLSDADNNRIIKITPVGLVLETLTGFERPMHIATQHDKLLVAEYGADLIRTVHHGKIDQLNFPETFDAPSGIDLSGHKTAVADFYNHRIVLTDGLTNLTFGKKGTGPGELTYPTDVQFAHDKIWVADAYNHRAQVFDLTGKHLKTFGETEKMNATTGLFVGETQVFTTDFENSRILVYDLDGKLNQIITENLDQPTDALQIGHQLFVVNYRGRFVSVFANYSPSRGMRVN